MRILEHELPFPTHRGSRPAAFTPEQIAIGKMIFERYRGHANAVRRDYAVIAYTEQFDRPMSARRMRDQISLLVRCGLPIGTSIATAPFGYFWIETEAERKMVRDSLMRMAISTLIHARNFDSQNVVAPILHQLAVNGFDVQGEEGGDA